VCDVDQLDLVKTIRGGAFTVTPRDAPNEKEGSQ
jgi:hypothetical protein